MEDILQTLYANLYDSSLIEGIAVFFGILSVWFARKENILVFPTGIISVLLYVYICIEGKIYADAGINVFYFVMSVFGWYNWTHKSGAVAEREISRTNRKQNLLIVLGFAVFFLILYYTLTHFTDSDVPVLDALTTSIFLLGMWLMALKKIENWILWIIGDLISIPLYFYKGYVLTSMQFIVFLILAIMGYIEWKQRLEAMEANSTVSG